MIPTTMVQVFILAAITSFSIGTWASERGQAKISPTSTVTIPIQEYLDLRQQTEKSSITSLENVRISGEYGKPLEIIFSGSSQGRPQMVGVLGESPGMSLSDCLGSGILQFHNQENEIGLLPQSARFQLKCRITFKSWEEVTLLVKNALFVKVDVNGIEPSIDATSMSDRRIIFRRAVRRLAEAPVMDEEPSVVARYQVSILPEETKFQYFLQMQNPNRTSRHFEFVWGNGEVVQKVTFSGEHTATKTGYSFKLEPGENHVTITGRLPKSEFRSTLKKALEYLVIENHPLLTVDVKSGARRVSLSDARVGVRFTGARAYLLGRSDSFNWASKELQIFPTSTFVVNQAHYYYYWAPRGSSLVEGTFKIDNQGSAEIPLQVPGKVTYLEVNQTPQVLAQDETGRLIVKVPVGTSQMLRIQYQTEKNAGRALASVSDELVRPQTAMTNVSLDVSVPREKSFIYKKGLDGQMDWAGLDWQLVLGAVVFYMYFKLFEMMGWSLRSRLFGGGILGFLTCGVLGLFFWVMVFYLLFLCIRGRERIFQMRPTSWRGWVLMCVLSLFGFLLYNAAPNFQRFHSKSSSSYGDASYEGESSMDEMAPSPLAAPMAKQDYVRRSSVMKGRSGGGVGGGLSRADEASSAGIDIADDELEESEMAFESEAAGTDLGSNETYQGLPAHIKIPDDGYRLRFRGGLFDQTQPLQFTITTLSRKLVGGIQVTLWILLGVLMWTKRKDFRTFLRLNSASASRHANS